MNIPTINSIIITALESGTCSICNNLIHYGHIPDKGIAYAICTVCNTGWQIEAGGLIKGIVDNDQVSTSYSNETGRQAHQLILDKVLFNNINLHKASPD